MVKGEGRHEERKRKRESKKKDLPFIVKRWGGGDHG